MTGLTKYAAPKPAKYGPFPEPLTYVQLFVQIAAFLFAAAVVAMAMVGKLPFNMLAN